MTTLQLASAGDDIKLWDCNGFTLNKQFNPHRYNVSSLAWSHDNSALASASTGGDKIVLTYSNSPPMTYDIAVGEGRICLAFNTMSRYIMGGGTDGTIHVWDLKTQQLKRSYKDHKGPVTSVEFNYNDTVIASASERGEIILYNVISGQGCSPLVAPKVQAVRQVQHSHFKKALLASVSEDGAMNLWDTNKRCLVHSFPDVHKGPATGLAFSPLNNMLLLSVGLDKRVICYDVTNKKAVKTVLTESPLTAVGLHSDGTTLAVGAARGQVYIYDLRAVHQPVQVLAAHKSSVKSLTFQHNTTKPSKSEAIVGSGSSRTVSTSHTGKRLPGSNNTNANTNKTSTNRPVNGTTEPAILSDINANANANGPITTGALLDAANSNDQQIKPALNNYSKEQDYGEVFSPIRERIYSRRWTPKVEKRGIVHEASPRTSGTGLDRSASSRGETSGKTSLDGPNTSTERVSDGVFSPLGADSGSANKRSHPIGANSTPASTMISSQPITTGRSMSEKLPKDVQQLNKFDLHNGEPMYGSTGKLSSGSQSRSDSSSKGSLLQDHEDLIPQRDVVMSKIEDRLHRSNSQKVTKIEKEAVKPTSSSTYTSTCKLSVSRPAGAQVTDTLQGGDSEAVGASGSSAQALQPFQMEVMRNMIDEALEEFRDQVRQDILNLHMEMLKQFQAQQAEVQHMLQQYSVNDELMSEIQRLREENKRLKQTF